jgi:predicted DNA-binding protein with PD1-like motif
MRYREGGLGRIFVLRLEHGDVLHPTVEAFCKDKGIRCAFVTVVGGIDSGTRLVVGPRGAAIDEIVEPVLATVDGVHEATGTGTVFLNEKGEPLLHMHLACGKEGDVIIGCGRPGVRTWLVLEVTLIEVVGMDALRRFDEVTGLEYLAP